MMSLHKLPLFTWAIFVTAILLLLSLPVLAGIFIFILLALNPTICWNIFLELSIFFTRRQSAGNLLNLGFLGILRDYTLECMTPLIEVNFIRVLLRKIICFSLYLTLIFNLNLESSILISFTTISLVNSDLTNTKNKNYLKFSIIQNKNYNPLFCSYLAGLIEGDGTIIVPKKDRSKKGKLNYPSIQICFDIRDLPLAVMIQKELGKGSISKIKGVNACRLTINDFEGIMLLINLLNGYFRTSKIVMFYNLIDFLNLKFPYLNIKKKNKNVSAINTDAWLSGFIEADGSFFVNATKKTVTCIFELVQSTVNHLGLSNFDIMNELSAFLKVKLRTYTSKNRQNYCEYRIHTHNIENNFILISYLDKYPLFSSKYLNYIDWKLAINIIAKKQHKTIIEKDEIRLIRDGMNNKRTKYIWDQLQFFYNLHT